jgi:23S rRNA (guanosine2251-2'-O)-methyltransferase
MKKNKKIITKPTDIVFGIHPIIELLQAKRRKVQQLFTTKPTPKEYNKIERLLPSMTQLNYVSRDALTNLAGTTDHQGVVAFTSPLPLRKKEFDPIKHPFLVLLDGIQDTRNMGGILRSAYCTGVNGVIIPQKNCAPLSGATFKASAGLAEHLEIYQPASVYQTAQELKAAGYTLYMAALGGESAATVDYKQPMCVVIGNESTGISRDLLKLGTKVMLPQKTSDISYNASVAAGILLFLIATKTKIL